MNLPSYDFLKTNYPTDKDPDAVRMDIGGQVAKLPAKSNTCTIRMSRAFNYAGKAHHIPTHCGDLHIATRRGGDGLHYALRVAEFRKFLIARYGIPAVSVRYKATEIESMKPFLGKRGIIRWGVTGWSDATGHFTLWNKDTGLYEAGEDYFSTAYFPRTVQIPLPSGGVRSQTIRETGVDLWIC
jgi:hypothetical protein